jgi:hypothetical protein
MFALSLEKSKFFVAYNSCTNNVVANVSSRHFQGGIFPPWIQHFQDLCSLLVTPYRMISTVNKN